MSDAPPTTAPKWTFDLKCGEVVNAKGRTLVVAEDATDDEMRLMASAPDLARALRERLHDLDNFDHYKQSPCICRLCKRDRALLAALPILPEEK